MRRIKCTCNNLEPFVLHRNEYGRPFFICPSCRSSVRSEICQNVKGNINGSSSMTIGYENYTPMALAVREVTDNE